MSDLILNSEYFRLWYKLADLRTSTKDNYKTHFRKFGRFMEECGFSSETVDFDKFFYFSNEKKYSPIDKPFIDDFVNSLKETNTDNSIYNTISGLKNFFSFLYQLDLIKHNPMATYNNPFYTVIIKNHALSLSQCKILLKAALELDPFHKSYAVLFLLSITCGLRANELISLTKSQINLERGVLFVNKGQKTIARSVAMTTSLKAALSNYFDHPNWGRWCGGEDKEVFFFEGKPLTYIQLRKILDLICKNAQVSYTVTPHQLRHTMAHLMQQQGVSIAIIKKQLRHKRLETTLRYLGLDPGLAEKIEEYSSNI